MCAESMSHSGFSFEHKQLGLVLPIVGGIKDEERLRECLSSLSKALFADQGRSGAVETDTKSRNVLGKVVLVFVTDYSAPQLVDTLLNALLKDNMPGLSWIHVVIQKKSATVHDALLAGWKRLSDMTECPNFSSLSLGTIVTPEFFQQLLRVECGTTTVYSGFCDTLLNTDPLRPVTPPLYALGEKERNYWVTRPITHLVHVLFSRHLYPEMVPLIINGGAQWWEKQLTTYCKLRRLDMVCHYPSLVQNVGPSTGPLAANGDDRPSGGYALDFFFHLDNGFVLLPALDAEFGDILNLRATEGDTRVTTAKKRIDHSNNLLASVGFNDNGWVKHELARLVVCDAAGYKGLYVKTAAWKDLLRKKGIPWPTLEEQPIPKVIHQVWIGNRQPPIEWIDTWRQDYVNKYPEWTHKLWREADVKELLNGDFENARLMESEGEFAGKCDIIRLNILRNHGGVYIDADTLWINGKSLDPYLEKALDTGFFIGGQPTFHQQGYPNGVLGSTRHHPFLKCILKHQRRLKAEFPTQQAWRTLGPGALTEAVKDGWQQKITIIDPQAFYPDSWLNKPKNAPFDPTWFPNACMRQIGYTTNSYTDADL